MVRIYPSQGSAEAHARVLEQTHHSRFIVITFAGMYALAIKRGKKFFPIAY